jgi:hypothetical protein
MILVTGFIFCYGIIKYSPAILDLMTLIFLDDNALCSLAKDERDGFIFLDDNVKYK